MPSPTCARSTRRVLDARRRAERATSRRRLGRGRRARCSPARGAASRPRRCAPRLADGVRGARRRRRARRHRRHPAGHGHRRAPTASASSPGSRSTPSTTLPERLVVVGSGVTGAELAQAYLGLGSQVVLVSSRDRVLPGEDADAATGHRGRLHASAAWRCSAARGWRPSSAPPTASLVRARGRPRGRRARTRCWPSAPCRTPAASGSRTSGSSSAASGHVAVDRVSRTSVRGVYAAGDCTGVLPLASVAAMQGRIAMSHALGDAVAPLNLRVVSANIFTDPEIATVGVSPEGRRRRGRSTPRSLMLPLVAQRRAPRCSASPTAS